MALPNGFDCQITDEVCCTSLFDQADQILDVAHTAVAACVVECAPETELLRYVTMGRQPADPVPNYVNVALINAQPSPQSRDTRGVLKQSVSIWVTFQVRLLESGWPEPTGDDEHVFYPDTDLYHAVSLHAYSHGEVMYRALVDAVANRTIAPAGCGVQCAVSIGSLVPIEPSGGTTGWQTQVIVPMGNCP